MLYINQSVVSICILFTSLEIFNEIPGWSKGRYLQISSFNFIESQMRIKIFMLLYEGKFQENMLTFSVTDYNEILEPRV
jgi:hypothetical protein